MTATTTTAADAIRTVKRATLAPGWGEVCGDFKNWLEWANAVHGGRPSMAIRDAACLDMAYCLSIATGNYGPTAGTTKVLFPEPGEREQLVALVNQVRGRLKAMKLNSETPADLSSPYNKILGIVRNAPPMEPECVDLGIDEGGDEEDDDHEF